MAQATTRDGTQLAYELHGGGRAAGRVALVHSLAMDRHFWAGVVPHLRQDFDVLVYDCRGHGESGKPPGPYTVEGFADDLADLLAAVGWPSAVVAGASMGGCVALAFAARHPARLDGLGLIDTTAFYGADAPQKWAERAQKAGEHGMASLVDFQRTRWFSDRFRAEHPEVVERAVGTFLANEVEPYAETCRMLGACDLRPQLAGIATPTAVLVGEEDYATPPAMAEAMHRGIPGATLSVLPGVRHFTPLEVPRQVADRLAALARLRPGC